MLHKPILIIWGAKDEQVPVSYGERLYREIKGAQLVIVPGAGHLILFDALNAVVTAITDFMHSL